MGNCMGKKRNESVKLNQTINKQGTIVDYNQQTEGDWNPSKNGTLGAQTSSSIETAERSNQETYTGSPLFGENDSQIPMSETMPKSSSINTKVMNYNEEISDQSSSPRKMELDTVVELTENSYKSSEVGDVAPSDDLNNINVKYSNSDEPPKFIPTPLANINPLEIIPKLKKISQISDSFSEAEIREILKPSFNELEVISNIDKSSQKSSLKFSEQSSIDQVTPIPSPRLSQKLAESTKKSSNASRFSAINNLGDDGNAYDLKHGTFSTESKPSSSSIPATPDTPQKFHLPASNSITTKQTETANSVFSPSPVSSPTIIPESQVENNGPKCTKPVSAVMQKQKQLQQHAEAAHAVQTNSSKNTNNFSSNSCKNLKTATTEAVATLEEKENNRHPVVQENPFSRVKKTNKKAADAKARALFKSCQDAANRTVIESMGNVDQRNNTHSNSTRPHFADSSKTRRTGDFELPNEVLKANELDTKVKSKGKDLYEKRQEHVEKWAEKSDQRRTKILDKQRASESGNSIALKSRVSEGSPGFDEKTTDKADQLYEDLKGKLKVVEGEDNLKSSSAPVMPDSLVMSGAEGTTTVSEINKQCKSSADMDSTNNSKRCSSSQVQTSSQHNFSDSQFSQSTSHFTHPVSGEMTMSARGAIQLEKDFHDSVDELLKLCSDVTDEATSQLAMQAKALSNEKSDPVKEDMFKRRLEHMNQESTRKQHHSGSNEYNFDQLQRNAQEKLLDNSNKKPVTPSRQARFSGEFSYADLVAAPKRPQF